MRVYPFRMAFDVGGLAGSDIAAPSVEPSWLLQGKVRAPALPAGYVRHASALQRLAGVLQRRVTALQAPGGFGKTTVLADIAQDLAEHGVLVGWMSLDGEDTPNLFGSYLAHAFELAGMEPSLFDTHDAWSSTSPSPQAVQWIGRLARALERHEAPCLLVLDEVDRLPRRTVRMVELLLKHAPRNLHVAMAFRASPALDLTTHVLDGGGLVVGAEALRFSRADIARFFDEGLSPAELAELEERTEGWPVALMVCRATRASEAGVLSKDAAQLHENYIRTNLLRDLSAEDRACLLDLALFERIESDLVDHVLGSSAARLRVVALPSLHGLLPAADTDGTVRRLHPLLREHCVRELSIAAPARKRRLHKRIAGALAGRGELTPAWRHAAAAGDSRLVGRLMEHYGVCGLWLREGAAGLLSAAPFVTPEIAARYPRLDLLRCVVLCLSSQRDEAEARFEAIARRTDGFSRDRKGGDADALAVDRAFAEFALAGGAGRLPSCDIESWLPAAGPGAVGDERGRMLAGARYTLLCIASCERARFEECRRHGLQARAHSTGDTRFGDVLVEICLGMAAMAQGRVEEAGRAYRRARQGARKHFSADPWLAASTRALAFELDLERNRGKEMPRRAIENMAAPGGIWVDVRSTAIAVSAELMLARYGSEAAVELLSKSLRNARATGIRRLSDHVSALLAGCLAEVGRPDEAAQVWLEQGLPCAAAELLDVERRSWRTMEALCCGRIRLLAALGESGAAEALASGLCAVASERGLTRTLLRGLTLSMVVAQRAAQPERAVTHLAEFLRAARGVDYVRPLVRHRDVSRAVLRLLLATNPDDDLRAAAESMQKTLGAPPVTGAAAFFTTREIEVLEAAARGLRNKEMAARLGISTPGVRYHLRNIYRRAGVGKRADAVEYARSLGVLR